MTYEELELSYSTTQPEQFASFVSSIRKALNESSLTHLAMASLLCRIADKEVDLCRRTGMKRTMDETERQRLSMSAKLLACAILLLCRIGSVKEARIRSLLFLEYSSYLNRYRHDLTELGINCCCYAMLSPGFDWSSLSESPVGTDILVCKMLEYAKFERSHRLEEIAIDSAGSLSLKDGKLHISSARSWESDVISFSDNGGIIEVCTRNIRDEKLKESNRDDILAVENFACTFIRTQEESKKMKPKKPDNKLVCHGRYSVVLGQEMRFSDGMPYLECHPLMTLYDGTCEIKEEELVKGIHTHELIEYLYEQDVIEGAVLADEEEPPLFSIKEAYKSYSKKLAEADASRRRVYEAKVVDIFKGTTPDKDRVRLISDKGYPGLMRVNGEYKKGDIVIVYTVFVNSSGSELFINMDKPEFEYNGEPGRFDGDSILEDFTVTVKDALEHLDGKPAPADTESSVARSIFKSVSAIISLSKTDDSMERLRRLLSAAFILNSIDDLQGRDIVLAKAEFLSQCLRAAEGIPVKDFSTAAMPDGKERWIINALAFLDKPEDISGVASLLQDASDADEKNIARLLMIYSLSCTSPDDFRSGSQDIRKKICRILGVHDHFRGEECKGGGKYGKGELADVEFKSSYVMSNKDGRPDLYYQGRGQVFEAVCGFMNRNGGTVYIGVNNYGDPLISEGYGIKGDLEWFSKNFDTVKILRSSKLGHPVPKPEDLDSYCRFLNDEVELYFKPSVRNCITISPTDDMDAIRIDVRPSEFEIVKLYEDNTWTEGTVYVRNGEETVPMNRHDQEQRLMKLRSVGKVEQFILTLTEAIDKKRKVILKGYSSSNSNKVKDRIVVPINLVYNNENLWAYDLEAKCTKEFRLARISSIETDIDDPGYHHVFEKGESDVFRWIDPKVNYHIRLKMSIAALNCMRDEYSDTKNLPETELYQSSPGKWILDTTLHGLGAVRRFYLGLADQIEIMETEDSEKLKAEIRSFADEYIK